MFIFSVRIECLTYFCPVPVLNRTSSIKIRGTRFRFMIDVYDPNVRLHFAHRCYCTLLLYLLSPFSYMLQSSKNVISSSTYYYRPSSDNIEFPRIKFGISLVIFLIFHLYFTLIIL